MRNNSNLPLYTCLRSHTGLSLTHQNKVTTAQSQSNQTLAVNPRKKRSSLSAEPATGSTNPERLLMLPRHQIFVIRPVQHQMIMASKRFALTKDNKRKRRALMAEEVEVVTTRETTTKTINHIIRGLASRAVEAVEATAVTIKRKILASTLTMARSRTMTSSIKVSIRK